MGEDPDLDLQHPAVLHLGDCDVQALGLEVVAHLRDLAYLLHDPAGHGGRVAGPLDLEEVVHIVQVGGAGDEVAAVRLLAEDLNHLIVFIPDLAHQLLHDVLHGGDAFSAAVLIHHHGHVGLVLLEDAQQLGDLGVAGGVQDGRLEIGQTGLTAVAGGVEVLLVDHAHDVVDAVVVDGETGIAALHKERGRLLHGGGVGDGHQIHTGSEDLGHLQIVELDGVADQIALMLVQAAFILRLIHHAHQLLLGDAVALSGAEHLGEQSLPLCEQEVGRGQDDNQ